MLSSASTMRSAALTRPSAFRAVQQPRRARVSTHIVAASTKLYVGNLAWSCGREDLQGLFGRYGEVEDAFIPLDRETGRSRGFGFVTMESEAAQQALELDGQEFLGRNLRVNEAQAREAGAPGGGRGMGGGRGGRGMGRGRGPREFSY